jgi:deoxyribose-phosphate aldolase
MARTVKGRSKRKALELAIGMIDLTTLEGCDTPTAVKSLCAKARSPEGSVPLGSHESPCPTHESPCPTVAAVCVYHDMVPVAVEALRGTPVKVASVSTAFPSGRATLPIKLADVETAVRAGADEIDMVIDRGAFLSGRYAQVFEEILAVRAICQQKNPDSRRKQPSHLKVILETGELGSYDNIRRAAWLAMLAGADFVKTSTGKISPAATPSSVLLLCQAARDWHGVTGQVVGVKPAGGIRSAKQAIGFLVLLQDILGERWLTPDRFRFGASSLLDDILLQRRRLRNGVYASLNHVPPTI